METNNPNSYLGTDETPVTTPTSDERTFAILAHVLTFVSIFLAPLIIWLIKKDDSPYVAAHAKESLNFQITIFICYMVAWPLMLLLVGLLLMPLIYITSLVLVIIATIKASENKLYRYPFNFRLIK